MTTPDSDSTSNRPTKSQKRDDVVQSPYDRLVDRTLRQSNAARRLLEFHLPKELLSHLKLDTFATADTSFIDPNLKRRFADRLFSIDISDEMVESLGMKTKNAYLLVLIDHKSTADRHTVVQMLGYIVRIWERAIENNLALAPIIPWVIYNGVEPWSGAKSLQELIPVPDSWKRYVPGLELTILDVSRMADSSMEGEPVLQMTLTLLNMAGSQILSYSFGLYCKCCHSSLLVTMQIIFSIR